MMHFSIVTVGQTWFSFGWESMLLEIWFLAIWSVPLIKITPIPIDFQTPWLIICGYRWLLLRVMLGARLVKIRGDPCWRNLTWMNYFYETQPIPNPLSHYFHQTPQVFHKFETLINHIVELILPWFVFLPFRQVNVVIAFRHIMFQCLLIVSGNLSFLNWLTIVPSLFLLDDYFWSIFLMNDCTREWWLQIWMPERVMQAFKILFESYYIVS